MLLKQRVRYLSGVCQSWGCLLSQSLLALPRHTHTLYLSAGSGWVQPTRRQVNLKAGESHPVLSLSPPSLPGWVCSNSWAFPGFTSCQTCPHDTSFCPAMPGTQEFIFSLCLCSPEAVLTSCLSSSLSFHPEPCLTPLVFHPWIKFSLCKIFKFSLLNPEWYKISPYPFYQFF